MCKDCKTLSKDIGSSIEDETLVEISDPPGIFIVIDPKDEDERLALSDALNGSYDGVVIIGAPM